MIDMTLIRLLNKGQGHSFWFQSISHIRLLIQSMWAERERSGKRSGAGGKRRERERSGERVLKKSFERERSGAG